MTTIGRTADVVNEDEQRANFGLKRSYTGVLQL